MVTSKDEQNYDNSNEAIAIVPVTLKQTSCRQLHVSLFKL